MATVEDLLKQQELIKQMEERYIVNIGKMQRELEDLEKEIADEVNSPQTQQAQPEMTNNQQSKTKT
ncbi:hypothetical protein TVAG_171840 [Trichomonas vaginalis G3]|uniref:Uncharacterized protein n=1 Tax=Trichomonas vaginalis (strain ATCC PRA-98 / G3) TaxID=412133 RepID=A2EWA9_TRIV3|nr:hypothetical protein TVAGG3_0916040 [Trichomonas vaginalis G3]EAY03086.1 hypothetical protein TVAG_171840 [Trichomonas vaginalis G3]KAI5484801.1 hypothetical protein TVAGG3_0916040 [Trichomonas vaginalis G3]|eukprot:XP_001315309.1 hypothetical protein [Trichomonas vaginalis G3]